jgi:hypothetical protein
MLVTTTLIHLEAGRIEAGGLTAQLGKSDRQGSLLQELWLRDLR